MAAIRGDDVNLDQLPEYLYKWLFI